MADKGGSGIMTKFALNMNIVGDSVADAANGVQVISVPISIGAGICMEIYQVSFAPSGVQVIQAGGEQLHVGLSTDPEATAGSFTTWAADNSMFAFASWASDVLTSGGSGVWAAQRHVMRPPQLIYRNISLLVSNNSAAAQSPIVTIRYLVRKVAAGELGKLALLGA